MSAEESPKSYRKWGMTEEVHKNLKRISTMNLTFDIFSGDQDLDHEICLGQADDENLMKRNIKLFQSLGKSRQTEKLGKRSNEWLWLVVEVIKFLNGFLIDFSYTGSAESPFA
jgi:hypothetical protein